MTLLDDVISGASGETQIASLLRSGEDPGVKDRCRSARRLDPTMSCMATQTKPNSCRTADCSPSMSSVTS
jgi:hypothetical protein